MVTIYFLLPGVWKYMPKNHQSGVCGEYLNDKKKDFAL